VSIAEALEGALTSANVPAQSAGAVALARRYARLLDEPAVNAKYRTPLDHLQKVFRHYRATVRLTPTEERGLDSAEATLTVALGEHSVASDLGPKLASILKELNLTLPAAAAPARPEAPSVQPLIPLDAERAEAQRLRVVR
jgi:hypothetical protein